MNRNNKNHMVISVDAEKDTWENSTSFYGKKKKLSANHVEKEFTSA